MGTNVNETKNGSIEIGFGVGGMPLKQFEEFEAYNKRYHNGCRWMAIVTLLEKARTVDLVSTMVEAQLGELTYRIEELEAQLNSLQSSETKSGVLGV